MKGIESSAKTKQLNKIKKLELTSKEELISELYRVKGKPTKTKYGYGWCLELCKYYNVDYKYIKEDCEGLTYEKYSKTFFELEGKCDLICSRLGIGYRKYRELNIKYDLVYNHMYQGSSTFVGPYPVWDLEIEDNHNFIVSEISVHNCSNPNLQQIPARNKEVRMLFKADEGKVFVGADFSAQEPRLLAAYSKDPAMIEAFKENKDLYAVMGQAVYKNNYEDNLEHYPDGSKFEAGTKRRKAMKSVLLGILYGMGAKALSERIDTTKEEAQSIIDTFYKGFPNVQKFINEGESNVKSLGYVEDLWGRRRRLPSATLPEWDYTFKSSKTSFNPLLYSKGINNDVSLAKSYVEKIKNCKWQKDQNIIKSEALANGIELFNNFSYISRAMSVLMLEFKVQLVL